MSKKKALSIIETALIMAVVAVIAITAMQKIGTSIHDLAKKTTTVTVNNN